MPYTEVEKKKLQVARYWKKTHAKSNLNVICQRETVYIMVKEAKEKKTSSVLLSLKRFTHIQK